MSGQPKLDDQTGKPNPHGPNPGAGSSVAQVSHENERLSVAVHVVLPAHHEAALVVHGGRGYPLPAARVAVDGEVSPMLRGGFGEVARQDLKLLHQFGFASALSELRLGKTELPIALCCFNVGVELGQLVFVAGLLALRPIWRRLERVLGPRLAVACHYAMGMIAMYWFLERIAAFLPPA